MQATFLSEMDQRPNTLYSGFGELSAPGPGVPAGKVCGESDGAGETGDSGDEEVSGETDASGAGV